MATRMLLCAMCAKRRKLILQCLARSTCEILNNHNTQIHQRTCPEDTEGFAVSRLALLEKQLSAEVGAVLASVLCVQTLQV